MAAYACMAKNKYDKEQIGGWHMRSLHLIKKDNACCSSLVAAYNACIS